MINALDVMISCVVVFVPAKIIVGWLQTKGMATPAANDNSTSIMIIAPHSLVYSVNEKTKNLKESSRNKSSVNY